MKNPPGLVHIITGGSANTTTITIDGVVPMVKRASIIIDPTLGENKIVLQCYAQQVNKMYEDGEVQVFRGISEENFEFIKGLFEKISAISDEDFDHPTSDPCLELLYFIQQARKKTNEQAIQ